MEVGGPPVGDQRLPEPTVERIERPDGRYVLYFSWPDEPPVSEPPADLAIHADE